MIENKVKVYAKFKPSKIPDVKNILFYEKNKKKVSSKVKSNKLNRN